MACSMLKTLLNKKVSQRTLEYLEYLKVLKILILNHSSMDSTPVLLRTMDNSRA